MQWQVDPCGERGCELGRPEIAVVDVLPGGDASIAGVTRPTPGGPVAAWLGLVDPSGIPLTYSAMQTGGGALNFSPPNSSGGRLIVELETGFNIGVGTAAVLRATGDGVLSRILDAIGVGQASAIETDDGGFVLALTHYDLTKAPGDYLEFSIDTPLFTMNVVRFDARGSVVWNQIGFDFGALQPMVEVLGFAPNGDVLISHYGIIGFRQIHSGGIGKVNRWRIARVDPRGNIRWIRDIPHAASPDAALAPDGSVLVTYQPFESVGDGRFDSLAPVVERIDPQGAVQWKYTSDQDGPPDIEATDGGGMFAAGWGWLLTWISLDGQVCTTLDSPIDVRAFQVLPDRSAIVAHGSLVAHVVP